MTAPFPQPDPSREVASSLRPARRVHGRVEFIDRARLPLEEVWPELDDHRGVVRAIAEMRIRGAPSMGGAGTRVGPEGVGECNLALDITPHRGVTDTITERGVVWEPCNQGPRRIMEGQNG